MVVVVSGHQFGTTAVFTCRRHRQSVEGPSAVSDGRWTDSVFTAIVVTRRENWLIAAVPPSSGRPADARPAACEQSAGSQATTATFTYRPTFHWLGGGRMADEVFDSAIH